MNVISYYDTAKKAYWLEEIRKCDWSAGQYLYRLLKEDLFFQTVGENSKVLLLREGEKLISFCTYAEKDDIPLTELTPWIGFVYTFPEYRGHRYFGRLLEEAVHIAGKEGRECLYISTDHTGLYEKYGCVYLRDLPDIHGNPSHIYALYL